MVICLSDCKWELKGYWPWVPVQGKSMETGQEISGATEWIDATVPGGVHFDLYRAGWIENPHFGLNSLKCEWVENRWWMYRTEFDAPCCPDAHADLVLKGLDYDALIYLNGQLLGEHKGMFEPKTFAVSQSLQEKGNRLALVFKGIPHEMGQTGFTSKTSTQKSRFNYKWDFAARMVNIGIWQDLYLVLRDEWEISDLYLRTSLDETGAGIVRASYSTTCFGSRAQKLKARYRLCLDGQCVADFTAAIEAGGKTEQTVTVHSPALWYPNGCGEQPLYDFTISLLDETDSVLHTVSKKIGIRSLEFARNENGHENALPYTYTVNGRRVYIKGVNITPIDLLYGNVTNAQYDFLTDAMVNANVNLVRIWGGGLIEKEILYDLCDKKGILIWQEFIQSSSGIDNIPCVDDDFLALLERNATAAVLEKRNHTCLAAWSGGNELMDSESRPVGYENKNIAMLKKIVEAHSPHTFFYPTSASGPVEFISETVKGVSHDVHGGWEYKGNPRQYEFYGNSDSLFHSEFGMDGTASVKTLKKILPQADQKPVSMKKSAVWRHHGEWWGTFERDTELFGEQTELKFFTDCSRYMQAEGLRFILEANRRRKFTNSGSVIWQLNEPFPNASCTCLMDYYGEAKPAYFWTKRAFAPRTASLDYRKLNFRIGETFCCPVHVSNSGKAYAGKVVFSIKNKKGNLLHQQEIPFTVGENKSKMIGTTDAVIDGDPALQQDGVFFAELALCDESGSQLGRNLYAFGLRERPVLGGLGDLRAQVALISERDGGCNGKRLTRIYKIKNTGEDIALNACIELIENEYWMLPHNNCFELFPGEEAEITAVFYPKQAGSFLADESFTGNDLTPHIKTDWFGNR